MIAKTGAKLRQIRWVLLLQQFDYKIVDRPGKENSIVDHLQGTPFIRRKRKSMMISLENKYSVLRKNRGTLTS